MAAATSHKGRLLVWGLVAVLFVMHQDCWFWDNRTLVFGFLPIGLFYHALFSLAAGLTWALANNFAWPEEIEAWAAEGDERLSSEGGRQ
jgi:hypothetical protein